MCWIHWYSGKTNVLRRRQKTEMLWEGSRRRFNSEFHIDGPATANARPLYVVHQCGGTVSWWLAVEQRCCLDAVSETGAQCAVRYSGALPSWHRRTIIYSLYLVHFTTSSQWRLACSSCVRPWELPRAANHSGCRVSNRSAGMISRRHFHKNSAEFAVLSTFIRQGH